MGIDKVKHIILVLSGKGGVGKSTVAVQLAACFADRGKKVGVLDVDLCGPSIPTMMGLVGREVQRSDGGWQPIWLNAEKTVCALSLGFLVDSSEQNTPIVWRGPKKTAIIKQFLELGQWGELDYLIIDTPPGTSDEHISLAEFLQPYSPDGCVIGNPSLFPVR